MIAIIVKYKGAVAKCFATASLLYPKYLFNHDSLHSSINIFEECDTSGMKCVYWHAESLVYPIGNATLFTAHKLASRRETAVPAFSPPDSPLFQFPVARNVCWYFPSITAPAFSRLHRLTSRLTARLPPPALNFFSASAGCIPSVRSVPPSSCGLWRDKPAFARLVTA